MSKCIICGKELNNKIYHLDNMPRLVQNMPTKDTVNEDTGMKLDLYECNGCGLIQFDCEPVYYYRDVIRAVGLSDTLKRLRHGQYSQMIDNYHLKGKKIWEVGCGGGEFLKLWDDYDVEKYGVEHNSELVIKARDNGLTVEEGFVDANYIDPNGPFDAFVQFNYLEHQPNPVDMVTGIYNNLYSGGVGLITVPSFEYFMEKASYYEFMRDHIAYYTEEALSNLLRLNGFQILDISRFNGDTTQIIVRKRENKVLPDFDGQKNYLQGQINKLIAECGIANPTVSVWGASHQALTLLATIDIDSNIKNVIDSSPMKWGYYTPVTHIEIISPDKFYNAPTDVVIIMAPAFSKEIAEQILENTNGVRLILAVKDDEVLIMKR